MQTAGSAAHGVSETPVQSADRPLSKPSPSAAQRKWCSFLREQPRPPAEYPPTKQNGVECNSSLMSASLALGPDVKETRPSVYNAIPFVLKLLGYWAIFLSDYLKHFFFSFFFSFKKTCAKKGTR